MKRKKGFTLAEILVTLGVIGVIASMTVPTLVQDIQDAQLKTAWKKAFADINQATSRLILDNAGSLKGAFANSDVMRNKYEQYLTYTKSCQNGQSKGNCWPNITKYLDGTVKTDMSNQASLVLNNGYNVLFWHQNVNCSFTSWGLPAGKPACAVIVVDINGLKEPNRWGKDIYNIWVLENTTLPYGTQGDNFVNKCEGSSGWDSGQGCGAKYLSE